MLSGIPNTMKGTFCQLEIKGLPFFLEIQVCEYDKSLIDRLEQLEVLSESDVGSFLELIIGSIPIGTRYLFKLESYNADKSMNSKWEFNESISNYEVRGFVSISDLLDFCESTWGVGESDFVPRNQTSVPK